MKYNNWHAGQRYIHHGTQAKYNQRQGSTPAHFFQRGSAHPMTDKPLDR